MLAVVVAVLIACDYDCATTLWASRPFGGEAGLARRESLQQRERLMALPNNYTQITEQRPSTRSRNTMLCNAWHFPSALWLITLLLMIPIATAIPATPTSSNIQRLTAIWLASNTPWGPPPKTVDHRHMPQLDWNSHLRWSCPNLWGCFRWGLLQCNFAIVSPWKILKNSGTWFLVIGGFEGHLIHCSKISLRHWKSILLQPLSSQCS